jgi:antitoxin component HigA of HigAB toxin-antitoxin module
MARKSIRPLRSEADHRAALREIEAYFEHEPEPGQRKPIASTFSRW